MSYAASNQECGGPKVRWCIEDPESRGFKFQAHHSTPHIMPQTQWSFVDLAPSREMWKSQGRCALDSQRSFSPIVGCGPWMPARFNSSPKRRLDRTNSQLILKINLAILGQIPSSRECLSRTIYACFCLQSFGTIDRILVHSIIKKTAHIKQEDKQWNSYDTTNVNS